MRNNGPDAVEARSSFSITGARVTVATSAGGNCFVANPTVTCNLASLASGASTTISYTVSATEATTVNVSGSVSFDGEEAVPANNSVTLATSVNAAPATASTQKSGGGGRLDWLALGLLGLLAGRRRACRSHREPAFS